MRKRKLISKAAAAGCAACLALVIWASPIATVPVQAAPPNTAETQQDYIAYRWKVENGSLWRRLYNYKINAWVGEWEYVGPYPPYI